MTESSSSGSGRHDELLESVVSGERSRDDVEVRAAAQSSEAFRAKLAALDEVTRDLVAAARDQRADFAYAAKLSGTGIEAAEDRLRERIALGLEHKRPQRWRIAIAAAAVLLVSAGIYWMARDSGVEPSPVDPTVYLGKGLECLEPIGACRGLEVFRWKGELPRGTTFELLVFDAQGKEIDRFSGLTQTELRVPAERVAKFPDSIEWQIAIRDSGGVLSSGSAKAWLVR